MDGHHAIVTSGGASHGAWQLGFALELVKHMPTFNPGILCGTSVGGLFAAFASQHARFSTAVEEYNDLWEQRVRKTKDIYKTWWPSWLGPLAYVPGLWKGSLFNAKPLQKLIREDFDPDLTRMSGKKLRLTSVDLLSGELVMHTEKTIVDWEPVYATAAFPLGFQMLEMEGGLHTDGGIREVAPLASAIDAGATEIDVLVTEPETMGKFEDAGGFQKTLQRGLRTTSILVHEVLQNDIRRCQDINAAVKQGRDPHHRFIELRVHRPSAPLFESSLNFDREVWTVNRKRGKEDAQRFLGLV